MLVREEHGRPAVSDLVDGEALPNWRGVECFAMVGSYLKEKGIALSVRGVNTGLSIGRLLADKTHGVSLFLGPRD